MSRFPPKLDRGEAKTLLSYIPHGYEDNVWKKYSSVEELTKVAEFRKKFLGDNAGNIKFIALYDSRNIRRKQTSDVIVAWDMFLNMLPKEKQEQCRLWLHTDIRDENGNDLQAVLDEVTPNVKAIFTGGRILVDDMVLLYNNIDVVVSMSSAEGWGLYATQCLLTEKLLIAPVTGGLQDQQGFVDENGKFLNPDIHYNKDWGTNADGRYKLHGEWCIPIFPNNRSLIGSPATPALYEDRCSQLDVANAIKQVYDMSQDERDRRGKLGREFAMKEEVGMTANNMANRVIDSIDEILESYVPPKKFGIYKP